MLVYVEFIWKFEYDGQVNNLVFSLATITPITFKTKTGEEPPSLEDSSPARLSRQVIQAVTQAVTQDAQECVDCLLLTEK